MIKAARFPALAIFSLVLPLAAVAAPELAAECNDCHGDNGVSRWDDVPTIAGVDAFSGSEALYAYRDKARPCTKSEWRQGDTSRPASDMCAETADLSDDDIEALAEHYAGLEFIPAKQEFDAALAAKGMEIHAASCDRCHSEGGSNPEDEAGILAGQWMGYLKTAFSEYRSGEREQLDKMKEEIDKLSDDDVSALVNYYASQQ
jgi:cytochrome subunit of sulfide dehydrogenase